VSTDEAILGAVMLVVLVPCAVIDLRRRIIPNALTGPGAVIALALGLALDPAGEWGRLLAGLLAGGFLLIAALIRPAGMGMGDVKLTAVMGLFLGAPVVVALFIAMLLSVLTGVGLALGRGVHAARKTTLPFGPYLALGGLIAAVVGHQIVHAYVHHLH
jgi:leader peptidase (prepilin peptidase)/N-methyltransferase